MTLQEAKAKYEANNGHYFEWFDFFGQELMGFYLKRTKIFIVKACGRYTVLGFNEDYTHVLGYGPMEGFGTYDEAKQFARNPGEALW